MEHQFSTLWKLSQFLSPLSRDSVFTLKSSSPRSPRPFVGGLATVPPPVAAGGHHVVVVAAVDPAAVAAPPAAVLLGQVERGAGVLVLVHGRTGQGLRRMLSGCQWDGGH